MSVERLADLLARRLPAGVAARGQALLQLQAALDRALPAPLVGHVRVRALENGVLALACASGAVVSRLRRETDTLVAVLEKRGFAVASVRSSVDPQLLAPYVAPHEKAGLPPTALDGLARLEAGIGDGPLKEALARLLRHHRS